MGWLDQARNQYFIVACTASVISMGAVSLYKIDTVIEIKVHQEENEARISNMEIENRALHTTNRFILSQIDRLNNTVYIPRNNETDAPRNQNGDSD